MASKASTQDPTGDHQDIRARRSTAEDERQWALAEKRIGRTPDARLRWLLRFLEEDLDALYPEERMARGYDLRMFSDPSFGLMGKVKGGLRGTYRRALGPMPETDLYALQADIRRGIQGLLQTPHHQWDIPAPQQLSLRRVSPPRAKKTRFVVTWQGEELQTILGGVFNLLLQAGEALKACVECRRPFVARKRQIYCSPNCSQRVRDRRKRRRVTKEEVSHE
jgi:hypothetical protein